MLNGTHTFFIIEFMPINSEILISLDQVRPMPGALWMQVTNQFPVSFDKICQADHNQFGWLNRDTAITQLERLREMDARGAHDKTFVGKTEARRHEFRLVSVEMTCTKTTIDDQGHLPNYRKKVNPTVKNRTPRLPTRRGKQKAKA